MVIPFHWEFFFFFLLKLCIIVIDEIWYPFMKLNQHNTNILEIEIFLNVRDLWPCLTKITKTSMPLQVFFFCLHLIRRNSTMNELTMFQKYILYSVHLLRIFCLASVIASANNRNQSLFKQSSTIIDKIDI